MALADTVVCCVQDGRVSEDFMHTLFNYFISAELHEQRLISMHYAKSRAGLSIDNRNSKLKTRSSLGRHRPRITMAEHQIIRYHLVRSWWDLGRLSLFGY